MQPPFQVTGNPTADWVVLIVGFVVCLYWLRALRLARQGARHFIRHVLKGVIFFCGAMVVFSALRPHTPLLPSQELVIAGFLAMLYFGRLRGEKRPRSIPKSVRKAVIERDLKGEQFDLERHHVDHVWPFSKGGSHTSDNLRVIEKKRNLKKGAKRPRMRDMW